MIVTMGVGVVWCDVTVGRVKIGVWCGMVWCGVVWYQLIRQMPRNRHILWVGGNEWVPPTLGLVIIVSSYQLPPTLLPL